MTRKDIFKIALFFIIPIPILYLAHTLIDKGLQRSHDMHYAEWNDMRKGLRSDALIMGSSRAWVHISPKILDSELHINSYNIGIDGWCFLMQHCRFKYYLEYNPKPKVIIQSLDNLMFTKNKELYDDLQFLPYIDNDTIIQRYTVGYTGSFNFMQKHLPMYKYRNNGELMVEGFFNLFNLPYGKVPKYKGYEGQVKGWDSSFTEFALNNPGGYTLEFDSSIINEFDAYLSYCQQNNIKVILVYTPEYFEVQKIIKNRDKLFEIYTYFADKYHCPLLDYSSDSLCYKQSLFYNSQHLNKQGAELFSAKLAKDIEKTEIGNNHFAAKKD